MEINFNRDDVVICIAVAMITCGLLYRSWIRSYSSKININRKEFDGTMINEYTKKTRAQVLQSAHVRGKRVFPRNDLSDATSMKHQVGGHPMLSFGSEYVIKLLTKDDRGFREVLFYEALRSIADRSGGGIVNSDIATRILGKDADIQRNARLLKALATFTAKYHGITSGALVTDSDIPPTGMILSNVTAGFQKPCVLDIKMGQTTYEPDATLEKKQSQQQKYPEQQIFGFRVIGMNVYDPSNAESDQNGFLTFDKSFGRQLKSAEDIQKALSTYFKLRVDEENACTVAMIQNVIRELERLRRVLAECNDGMRFIASSILIVYEGAAALCKPEKYTVKMIDFAHVRYNPGGDLSFIYGLDTIITVLRSIF